MGRVPTSDALVQRTLRALTALLLAMGALLSAGAGVLTSVLAYQRAVLPYNGEGHYFDGIANYHDGAQFVYGGIALIAFVAAGGMIWLAYRLMRRDRSLHPTAFDRG